MSSDKVTAEDIVAGTHLTEAQKVDGDLAELRERVKTAERFAKAGSPGWKARLAAERALLTDRELAAGRTPTYGKKPAPAPEKAPEKAPEDAAEDEKA